MGYLWRGLAGLILVTSLARADIRIVGSDLLAEDLASALSAYAKRNELKLKVEFGGSQSGWRDLSTGQADIGLLSFAPGEALPAEPYFATPVAYHVAVVLAPAALPLGQVSFAQLAGVFGQGEGTAWKRWADLGVTGDLAARSVVPRVLRPRRSLVLQLFRYEVLRSRPLRSGLATDSTPQQLTAHLLTGEEGVALAPLPQPDEPRLKTLAVARETGGVAFLPTALNAHRGDYPLRWPLYLVFRRADTRRLYPVLRFLLGDEAAASCRQAQLLPVPAEARAEAVFGLEQL